MLEVKMYEEAMCCSTGVCGPSPDQKLIEVTRLTEKLKNEHITVERFNLSSHPKAFLENKEIMNIVKEIGNDVLPITVINGDIVKTHDYITEEEADEIITVNNLQGGNCCNGSNCC
ncbi:arsenite efflux transporter metallochaperone ArsD [Macrococcus brunensis]|uniref:arsenite efflux transporter metallochaperone ArsD n=1 Tax=Macrococcus brunensis TaxID=198483 RepID=UPI001EF04E69|nr:arsenite efflux transporter metallochaperone ArsD [Macrococcus brunensis]ULG74479.1 arsenite efflux transporter metallochaperone ArsD [Macrococcus brunensis]